MPNKICFLCQFKDFKVIHNEELLFMLQFHNEELLFMLQFSCGNFLQFLSRIHVLFVLLVFRVWVHDEDNREE